jgi:hypothetical protein
MLRLLEPYWWSGNLCGTVHCMKALEFKGTQDDSLLITQREWIAERQLIDGSWTDSLSQQSVGPFDCSCVEWTYVEANRAFQS